MSLSWSWGFSTDQNWAKLDAIGWDTAHATNLPAISQLQTRTYTGDAASDRASLRYPSAYLYQPTYSPAGSAATAGWVAASCYCEGTWYYVPQGRTILHVSDGSTEIKIGPAQHSVSSTTIGLYVNGSLAATSTATASIGQWHRFAVKYDGSTSTAEATVYLDGVEIIALTSGAITAFVASGMRIGVGPASTANATHYADLACWDSTSDSGEVTDFFCTTFPVTSDDSNSGGWTKSTGSTFFGVTAPWDVSTYAEEATPVSGDSILMGCADIATRLGVSPASIHGATAHLVATGGGDVQAIAQTTSGTGATVTTSGTDPTPAFSTNTSITVGTALKCGIKVP